MYTIYTLLIMIGDIALVLFAPFLIVRIICSVLLGLLMVRMFIIYHDYEHHAILYKSPLARILMPIYGAYVLNPESIWKRSHDHHHKHNSKLFASSIGSYLIVTKSKFMSMSKSEQRIYLASRHPLIIVFGYFFIFMIGMCLMSFISNPRKHFDSLLALIAHFAIAFVLVWFMGWQAWLLAMFIPFMISSAMGAYLFYAQHNFPGASFSDNGEWAYEKAAMESSSFMDTTRIMHWFTGNIGYHHIHHLNSRIPFYRLREAMKGIPELQNVKSTTLSPKDIIACLRLKVWDQDRGKMVHI